MQPPFAKARAVRCNGGSGNYTFAAHFQWRTMRFLAMVHDAHANAADEEAAGAASLRFRTDSLQDAVDYPVTCCFMTCREIVT